MLLKSQASDERWEQAAWGNVRGSYFFHVLSYDDYTEAAVTGEPGQQYMRMAGDMAEHLQLVLVR